MTPSATPMLTGSTGQLEASETVRFGVDGRAYEIDLSARHAGELRSMAGRYIRAARKVPSATSRARQQSRPHTHTADEYETTVRVAPIPSRAPGTDTTPKPSTGDGTARAAQDKPASTANMAATEGDVRGGEHGLSDREKQELRAISDAAKPLRNIVAGRLLTKGLADRDTAGNWWLTDAGRRKLTSA